MQPFLAKHMFQCQPDENPELWSAMSPIERIGAEAPPFLVIQGSHDSLVWADEAREFTRALREKSQSAVHYLEFPGGQHAFDTFHSVRSAYAVRAAAAFLESVRPQNAS
jgi:acetyl esterase/lipase